MYWPSNARKATGTIYTITTQDGEYVYSTKFVSKLFGYCRDIISIGEPKDIDDCERMLSASHFWLFVS